MSIKPKGDFKSFGELPDDFLKKVNNIEVEEINSSEDIFEAPESATKNRKLKNSKEKIGRKFQRKIQRDSLPVQEVDFESEDEFKVRARNPEDLEGIIFKDEYDETSVAELPNADSIEGQEFDLYENTYDPNGSSEVEMPDPAVLEGKEIPTEKEKKLKSAIDLAMEKTDEEANEYNSKKLTYEDIESAKSISELLEMIDKSEGIQGTKEYFDTEKLKMIIEMYVDGDEQLKDENGNIRYEYLTRSGGLRQKVFDLLNEKKTTPTPLTKKAKNIEVVPAQVDEKEVEEERYKYMLEDETVIPAEHAKENQEDYVFKIPEISEEERNKPKEELPEAPLPELKGGKFIVDQEMEDEMETPLLEKKLLEKNKTIEDVDTLITDIENIGSEKPFKKFLFKIGIGADAKRLNRAEKLKERAVAERYEIFNNLVATKTRVEFNRIMALDPRSKERRNYETFKFTELPDKIIYGNLGIIDYYKINDQNNEGLHTSKILSVKNIKSDVADELNSLIRRKIEQKVREEFGENKMK